MCIFLHLGVPIFLMSFSQAHQQCPNQYPCNPGYTYNRNLRQCYKLYAGGDLTFDMAENRCQQDGAHLVSIHSKAENDYVTSLAYTNGGATSGCKWINAWIGLNYTTSRGWGWTDGTPVDYKNWDCGLPDGGNLGCAFTNTAHSTEPTCGYWYGLWDNAHACDEPRAFVICKHVPKK